MLTIRELLYSKLVEYLCIFATVFVAHFAWYAFLHFAAREPRTVKPRVFTARDIHEAMSFMEEHSRKPVQMVVDATTYSMAVRGWAAANQKLAEIRAATAVLDEKVKSDGA